MCGNGVPDRLINALKEKSSGDGTVVKEGESMQTIVDKTGVDACDIIKINQLKDILLKPGITIMLPVEK